MISKEWLVGFIEGEGNFNVSLVKNFKSPTWNYPYSLYPVLQFRIFLREDDIGALNKIRDFLGVGRIYKKKMSYARDKGWNAQDQYAYYVTSVKDLLKVREVLLSSEFHTKKKKDFELFFKILDLKISKKHLTSEGFQEIMTLASSMNSQNRENFHKKSNPKELNR